MGLNIFYRVRCRSYHQKHVPINAHSVQDLNINFFFLIFFMAWVGIEISLKNVISLKIIFVKSFPTNLKAIEHIYEIIIVD